MPLTVDEVARIAREAARSTSPTLDVVGVTLGGSTASGYVEILVNITGGRHAPCKLEIGAFRDVTDSALRDQIAATLRDHLAQR